MRFVIVTGMSGSGKTQALKMLEDMGYFCVDNLPLELIGKFAELAANPAQEYSKVALGLDVRSLYKGGGSIDRFLEILNAYPHEILYLDCRQEQLVRRYKATRRLHPLSQGKRIEDGIAAERSYLMPLRDVADYVIDTSDFLTRQLMEELSRLFSGRRGGKTVSFRSFRSATNTGIPSDADLVFDVRFLPNPFYVDELKHKTGNDTEVQQYVCQRGDAEVFLEKVKDLLEFPAPEVPRGGETAADDLCGVYRRKAPVCYNGEPAWRSFCQGSVAGQGAPQGYCETVGGEMSFSSGVKEELASQNPPARHCRIALIAALFHMCPVSDEGLAGIRTENEALVRAFENALRRAGLDRSGLR